MAIGQLVAKHAGMSVALNASSPPLPAPYRLRVMIEQETRRPRLPRATAQEILDEVDQIARLAEG
jgi:hypothetical protein